MDRTVRTALRFIFETRGDTLSDDELLQLLVTSLNELNRRNSPIRPQKYTLVERDAEGHYDFTELVSSHPPTVYEIVTKLGDLNFGAASDYTLRSEDLFVTADPPDDSGQWPIGITVHEENYSQYVYACPECRRYFPTNNPNSDIWDFFCEECQELTCPQCRGLTDYNDDNDSYHCESCNRDYTLPTDVDVE